MTPRPRSAWGAFSSGAAKHGRILWALFMRELATRYGRDNIGYLWLIAEPLIFAGGVAILWSVREGPLNHGVAVVPFVITGYMPLILIRQTVSYTVGAVKNNHPLLYHRQITPLHLFLGRIGIEFIGVSLASAVVLFVLGVAGVMTMPRTVPDICLVYGGWFLEAWLAAALAMFMGALAEIIDFVERFIQIITYILIPLSGAFYMAGWMPPNIRKLFMILPFIHGFEMIRGGFFGPLVMPYYDVTYAVAWALVMTLVALFLVQYVRNQVEID